MKFLIMLRRLEAATYLTMNLLTKFDPSLSYNIIFSLSLGDVDQGGFHDTSLDQD